MDPITRLHDLAVVRSRVKDDDQAMPEDRVELIDTRIANEIISLPPKEAEALAVAILAKLAPVGGGRPADPGA